MASIDRMHYTVEKAAYYKQQALDINTGKVTGPDITIDLSDDIMIITDDNA